MNKKKVLLEIEPQFYKKIDAKRKYLGFESVQQYFYAIARRDVFRKKAGGRPDEYIKAARLFTMKKVLTTKGGKPFKI